MTNPNTPTVDDIQHSLREQLLAMEKERNALHCTLQSALLGLSTAAVYLDDEDDPQVVQAVEKALQATRDTLNREVVVGTLIEDQATEIKTETTATIHSVIAMYDESGQVVCDHVEAFNGPDAMRKVAKMRPDCVLILSIKGEHSDSTTLDFPGEGVVDASSYVEIDDEDDSDEDEPACDCKPPRDPNIAPLHDTACPCSADSRESWARCECGRLKHTCLAADGGDEHGDKD